jgi:hypothetical protein
VKKLTLNESEKNILIRALKNQLALDSLNDNDKGTAEILLIALKRL